ncbi:hypothetical protein QZH41_003752 [Actinostola sp. cb2023]|nr:hypothetical protein QZH41_003752 [Actinostola sp. cb2023]
MADAKADHSLESAHHVHHEDDSEIWEVDWKNPDLAWHVKQIHPLLIKHEREITGGRSHLKVLVPLCGISVDLLWFADRGDSVCGIEYDASGCQAFFEINNIEFDTQALTEEFQIFKGKTKDITLYQCDFFKFPSLVPSLKGSFDVIWDRAALRTTVGEPIGQNAQAYVDVLRELVSTTGCLAQENTRFDVGDCKTEFYPPVVSDEVMEGLAKEKWNVKKLDQLEYKVGEGLELFYRDYKHDISLHLLTPK